MVGVDADDGIEVALREREVVCLGQQRRDELGLTRGVDPAPVLGGLDPEVGGDDLNVELLREEDRGDCPAASKVEDAGAGRKMTHLYDRNSRLLISSGNS